MEDYGTQGWTPYASAPDQYPPLISSDVMPASSVLTAQGQGHSQLMFVPQIHRPEHQSYSATNSFPYSAQEQSYDYYISPGSYMQATPPGSRTQPRGIFRYTHNP